MSKQQQQLPQEKQKRTTRTKIFAVVSTPSQPLHVLEAPFYTELRTQIEGLGECTVHKIVRGRDIPFQAKASVKFF